MNIIFLAQLHTENFLFQAIGLTKAEAREALTKALRRHATDLKIPRDWYVNYLDAIGIQEMEVGQVYRDTVKI